MNGTLARLLGAVALTAVIAPPARAADAPQITVGSLKFTGVTQVDESQLRSVLATRASSRWPWGRKERFNRAEFEADIERIRAFYVDRGFPDARVTSFDVNLNEKGDRVGLVVHVSEGEPIRVAELRYEGFDALSEREHRRLRRRAPLKEGQPFDRAALATTREVAANELRDNGYPYPEITARGEPAGRGQDVAITLVADAGPRAYFGETSVEGVRGVGDDVVRRSLLFEPGDLYRLSVLRESQRKLYNLELFDFVNVAPARDAQPESARQGQDGQGSIGSQPGLPPVTQIVPMKVTVTEGKHRRVRFSLGYGTEEKARGEVEYRRLSFLGGARSASVRGKWSSLERGARLQLEEPYLFAPRWSLALDGQRWYSVEPMYRAVTSGGNLTVAYQPGTLNTFSITATSVYQSSRISNEALSDLALRPNLISFGLDPTTGAQDGLLNALSFDAQRSTTDNPLNATRGYAVTLHLERAATWLSGDYSYLNISADLRYYKRFRRVIVALRGRAGTLDPTQGVTSNVPFAKRFFLGGSTSLRGWGRYEVSPLSGSGLPLGGFSMAEASVEARARVFGQLAAVVFLDAGNVWSESWRLDANDLRYSVGPGLRYHTPIGPVRVDLGYQLNPVPGLLIDGKPETRRWRVHFSIGQAF